MKKWGVGLACAVAAAVAIALTFFRSSDEDRIRKTLDQLAQIVMVKDGDTIFSRTARLRSRMKDVVDDDVRADIAELNLAVRGRTKLEEDGAKAGLLYAQADVAFTSVSIKVDPDGTLATADAVAVVTAQRGGQRQADKRNVHFLLRKDGDWKITTIDVGAKKEGE